MFISILEINIQEKMGRQVGYLQRLLSRNFKFYLLLHSYLLKTNGPSYKNIYG